MIVGTFSDAHQHIYILFGRILFEPRVEFLLIMMVEIFGCEVYDGVFNGERFIVKPFVVFGQSSFQ